MQRSRVGYLRPVASLQIPPSDALRASNTARFKSPRSKGPLGRAGKSLTSRDQTVTLDGTERPFDMFTSDGRPFAARSLVLREAPINLSAPAEPASARIGRCSEVLSRSAGDRLDRRRCPGHRHVARPGGGRDVRTCRGGKWDLKRGTLWRVVGFDLIEERDERPHTFRAYACRCDGDELVDLLAATVRELYVKLDRLREVLTSALADLDPVADTVRIEEAITRTVAAAIPEPGSHPVPQLDVARNELAEAIAHVALPCLHGTLIPAPKIENKEIRQAPARGVDLLGLEDNPIAAVIGEVKASSDAESPPSVVGDGRACLRSELLSFLGDGDRLLAELNFALKHAKEEHCEMVGRAMMAHVLGTLKLVAAPVLVRPRDRRGPSDYGVFLQNPTEYRPASVRFSIFVIEQTLDDLARAVYERARR